jgi:pyrroline-5-carboxylate reductase
MRWGFIGAGNMAQTMIKGFIENNALTAGDIFIYDTDQTKQENAVKVYGVTPLLNAGAVLNATDVTVLAVKPGQLNQAVGGIKVEHMPVLVSLPVGIAMETVTHGILRVHTAPVIRIIPNISAEVGASVTALCANENVTGPMKQSIIKTLEALGSVTELPEKQLDIFTVIASSAPVFVIRFTEALAQAALREGLPIEDARRIITDMLAGTAKMMAIHSGYSITDRICSPGGTTITGLVALTEHGFDKAVHKAAKACMERLSKG